MPLYEQRMDSVAQTTIRPHFAAIVAFLFFYFGDLILKYIGELLHTQKPDPYAFNRMRNYSLSVIHAVCSGTVSLLYLLIFQELLEDIVSAEKESAYLVLGFSTGYFIHDIYHNYCSGLCMRSAEIILHHLTVVLCFIIVITYRILLPYALFGLLMELNSIFLHMRQILRYFDVSPNSFLYRMNANANVGSFIVFRLFLTLGLDYWAIAYRHRLPVFVSTVLIMSFTVITVMNSILFFRILASEKRILEEYNNQQLNSKTYVNGTVPCDDGLPKMHKTE